MHFAFDVYHLSISVASFPKCGQHEMISLPLQHWGWMFWEHGGDKFLATHEYKLHQKSFHNPWILEIDYSRKPLFSKFPHPPKRKGGGSISTSKQLLDFEAPVVPAQLFCDTLATKFQSHSSPNGWWTAYSALLRALVLPKFAEKNQRLSYLQLVFWDLLSISWQQVSIYNVRVQVVALYVGCGDDYLNVWCIQQHGDQVLAQLHLKTGWRYSVPSMEQSEHLNSIQDVQKDLLCKRSTLFSKYMLQPHTYTHVRTCDMCLVSIRAEKNSYILQVWSSWDWLRALFSNSYCSSRGQLSIAFTVCTTSLSSPSTSISVEGEVWNLYVFVPR